MEFLAYEGQFMYQDLKNKKKNIYIFSTFCLEHVTRLGEYILYIVIAKDKIIWNGLGLSALL